MLFISPSAEQRIRFQLRRPRDSEGGVCCKPHTGGDDNPSRSERLLHWGAEWDQSGIRNEHGG